MPLYEYECDACGQRFEVIQKFSDPPAAECVSCGKGPVRRLLSSPAIQFKGSGWYITDYAQKGKSDGAAKSSGGDTGAKTDAKSDAKSDAAKKDAKADTSSTGTSSPSKS